VRAMILAAGEGLRLRPLTEHTPKALVEVGGRPLIEYALETVARAGISEAIVNLHHFGDRIRAHLADGRRFGLRILYSEEPVLLGSGGGLRHAQTLLGPQTFVTLNADTIIDIDLAQVLRFHREKGAIATMVLRKDARMAHYGLIQLERNGRVGRFLRHIRAGVTGELEPYMFTGVQILEPRVFAYMPAEGAFSITEATYPRMLAAGEPIFGYPFEGMWLTVGTADELAHARHALDARTLD